MPSEILVLGAFVFGLAALATLVATLLTVEQRATSVLHRFGRVVEVAGPRLHANVPFFERASGRMSRSVHRSAVFMQPRNTGKALTRASFAVQYYVLPKRAYDTFCKPGDPTQKTAH